MIERAFDAVLFDLDDTLHDDTATYRFASRRVADEIARERGVDATALYETYNRIAEAFWTNLQVEHLRSSMQGLRAKLWGEALAEAGAFDEALAQRAASHYNSFRAEGLRLFPGVIPLLDGLREAGRRTALITNGFAETHREKIALLRLERAFDAVILADEVGMVKPDPQIFVHACELVGVAPQDSVMVGDRYDRDIEGAARAGLATIWLNLHAATLPEGRPVPDAIVPSFEAVCAALAPSLRPGRNALSPGSV